MSKEEAMQKGEVFDGAIQPLASGPVEQISLVDLGVILVKQKYVFIISFLLVLILGSSLLFKKTDVYEYNTTLVIGSYKLLVNGGLSDVPLPIESPEGVVAKLMNVFIPSEQGKMFTATGGFVGVEVKPVNDTDIVVIASRGGSDDSGIRGVHQNISDSIIKDHKRLLENKFLTGVNQILQAKQKQLDVFQNEVSKRNFLAQAVRELNRLEARHKIYKAEGYLPPKIVNVETDILSNTQAFNRAKEFEISLKLQLSKLVEQEKLAKERVKFLSKNKSVNQLEINDLRRSINIDIPIQRSQLIAEINSNEKEGIDAEKIISSLKVQRIILQEEFEADEKQLEDDLDLASQKLILRELEYEQKIEDMQSEIKLLEDQIRGVNLTRAISIAERKVTPIGYSGMFIISVVCLVALTFSLVVCFFAAYIAKVRSVLKEGG